MDAMRARLQAWRERGEDRADPLRFHFMEALCRRTAGLDGDARRLLEERLSEVLRDYAAALDGSAGARSGAEGEDASGAAGQAEPGPLAALLADLDGRAPGGAAGFADPGSSGRPGSAVPEPSLVDYFRDTWSRVGANRLLRQARARVPENAGPLNSSNLAHRSLVLMRELSPGYLEHFLSYVDALSWMEQMSEGRAAGSGQTAARPRGERRGG